MTTVGSLLVVEGIVLQNTSERGRKIRDLEDVLATVLLLALVDDLEEFFEGNSSIARDISLLNDLVNVGLWFNVVELLMY